MSGAGGITDAIDQLLVAFGLQVPPWFFPVLVAVVALLLSPKILANMRTSKARRIIKRARILDGAARRAEEARALKMVGGSAAGLVAVADEAVRARRTQLALEATRRLAKTGKERRELRRLRNELDEKMPGSAEEAALVLERLLTAGLVAEAQRRLARFERRFGPTPTLDVMGRRVRAAQVEEA